LISLNQIRSLFDRKVFVNYAGMENRGLRMLPVTADPNGKEFAKLGAHYFGRAFDITVEGLTAEEVFKFIMAHPLALPFISRIYAVSPTTVHIEVSAEFYTNKGKIEVIK